jgi:hypothetical protein
MCFIYQRTLYEYTCGYKFTGYSNTPRRNSLSNRLLDCSCEITFT